MGALLVSLASRRIPDPYRSSKGVLRVIAEGPGFASMLALSFDAITDHAADHAEVHASLLTMLGRIAEATTSASRRHRVLAQLDLVLDSATRAGLAPWRLQALQEQWSSIRAQIH